MDENPSIRIQPGWTGAAFRLDRPGAIPATLELGAWRATLQRGRPFLAVEVQASMRRGEAEGKTREIAEKSLDLLAAGGGGAYRIGRDDASVHWWTRGREVHASIHGRFYLPFDWSLTVRQLNKPGELAGHSEAAAVWRPGFRFFRMGQTARHPVAAFRDTYLAVENLLADLYPHRMNPRREPEKQWLVRALDSFNKDRPHVEGRDWLGHMGLDDFVDTVYSAVRHSTFHAKAGESFLVPLDAKAEKQVRRAMVPLTRLFLELAAEKLKWPLNERPQLEHDMMETGQWRASIEAWPFEETPSGDDEDGRKRTILREVNDSTPAAEPGTAESVIPRQVLEHVSHVDGWTAFLNDKPIATEELGVRLPVEWLASLTLRVAALVRFGALVRTEFR